METGLPSFGHAWPFILTGNWVAGERNRSQLDLKIPFFLVFFYTPIRLQIEYIWSMRLQATINENLFRVLTEMGDIQLRGKDRSEVAYNILEQWVWDNELKLEHHGIFLTPKSRSKKRPKSQPDL
jgi:hypothetical protein